MKSATKRSRRVRIDERWRRYLDTRDRRLRNELVETYLPLVRALAAKLASRLPPCVDLEDLRSAGFVGLVNAVEHFDPSRRVKFEIYGKKRITGSMLDELRRQDSLPRDARERADELRKTVRTLRDRTGREPTEVDVAHAMGLSRETFREVLQDIAFATRLSLDPASRDGESSRRRGHEPVDGFPQPPEVAHRRELLNLVDRFLNPREKTIVRGFYQEERTLKHIGTTLRLSESRISQMHTELLSRLRRRLVKEVAP